MSVEGVDQKKASHVAEAASVSEGRSSTAVLRDARSYIEKPESWARNVYRDLERRCALGALLKAQGNDWESGCDIHSMARTKEYSLLKSVMGEWPGDFNDTHTHEEVLAAFDRAIAAAEIEERDTANGRDKGNVTCSSEQ